MEQDARSADRELEFHLGLVGPDGSSQARHIRPLPIPAHSFTGGWSGSSPVMIFRRIRRLSSSGSIGQPLAFGLRYSHAR
jgi:hypothetical protein